MTDTETIDSLRDPGFSRRVWGYDSYQVDGFLEELRERLEAAEQGIPTGSPLAGELTGVGEKVDAILAAAREAAERTQAEVAEQITELKRESEESAEQLRREADEYATKTRSEADEYEAALRSEAQKGAAKVNEEASSEAEAKVSAAEQEAEQMLRDARIELGRIEESIEDLRERRQLVITSIERLRGSLGSMVGEASQGTVELAALDEEALALADEGEGEERTEVIAGDDGGDAEPADEVETGAYDAEEEYETGEWEAVDGDEPRRSETERYRFTSNGGTEEQAIRSEDL